MALTGEPDFWLREPTIAHVGRWCLDARLCYPHTESDFHGYDPEKVHKMLNARAEAAEARVRSLTEALQGLMDDTDTDWSRQSMQAARRVLAEPAG